MYSKTFSITYVFIDNTPYFLSYFYSFFCLIRSKERHSPSKKYFSAVFKYR